MSRPALSARRLAPVLLAAALPLAACAGTDPAASESSETASASASATSSSSAPATSAAAPSTPAGRRVAVQVAGGQVTGDTGRVPVAAGEQVTLVVTADVPDEVHVHGYDLTAPLTPGRPAELTFDATIPGVFEVELHAAGTVLLTLQVS